MTTSHFQQHHPSRELTPPPCSKFKRGKCILTYLEAMHTPNQQHSHRMCNASAMQQQQQSIINCIRLEALEYSNMSSEIAYR